MFGLFKKTSGIREDYTDFLNEVDEYYMRAFSTRAVNRLLSPYLTRECIVKVSRKILSGRERYFGAEKFRRTSWVLLCKGVDEWRIKKVVEFDKIRVAGQVAISIAPDYVEEWSVDFRSKPYQVKDIQDV